jgi:hypothetical protein
VKAIVSSVRRYATNILCSFGGPQRDASVAVTSVRAAGNVTALPNGVPPLGTASESRTLPRQHARLPPPKIERASESAATNFKSAWTSSNRPLRSPGGAGFRTPSACFSGDFYPASRESKQERTKLVKSQRRLKLP